MATALLSGSVLGSRSTTVQTPSRQLRLARCQPSRRQQRQPVQALFGGGNKEGGGGNNPFANMGALMENMKKAQEVVQVEAAKVQEELAAASFEGYSEDETVCVTMTGNQEPTGCDITDQAYQMGAEVVSTRVTEAMKDAHQKSTTAMKSRMRGLASSLGLPQQ